MNEKINQSNNFIGMEYAYIGKIWIQREIETQGERERERKLEIGIEIYPRFYKRERNNKSNGSERENQKREKCRKIDSDIIVQNTCMWITHLDTTMDREQKNINVFWALLNLKWIAKWVLSFYAQLLSRSCVCLLLIFFGILLSFCLYHSTLVCIYLM